MRLKIYADKSLYVPEKRKFLHNVLKANWNDRSDSERRAVYGRRLDIFEIVPSIEQADVCLLTNHWNYYLNFDKVDEAVKFAREAEQAGKQIIVWCEGDYGVQVSIPNAVLFQLTVYRSRRQQHEYALPPAFDDYVEEHLGGQPQFRQKGPKPVVGFCGQAGGSSLKLMLWRMKNLQMHGAYRLGLRKYMPPDIEPSAALRAGILDVFSKSSVVETNFILREQYRGGMDQANGDIQQRIKQEFIDNLNNSDYIVCVRGTGNWSKRFYEALNWGRIPIFFDTDCVLPYDFAIDWKKYCVWIDQHEVPHAAEKVADFHASLTPDDFIDLQRECRKLWLERLSVDGFYEHFHEHFTQEAASSGNLMAV